MKKYAIYDRKKEEEKGPEFFDEYLEAGIKKLKKEGVGAVLKKPLDEAEKLGWALFRGLGDSIVRAVQISLMYVVFAMTLILMFRGFFYLMHWIFD